MSCTLFYIGERKEENPSSVLANNLKSTNFNDFLIHIASFELLAIYALNGKQSTPFLRVKLCVSACVTVMH